MMYREVDKINLARHYFQILASYFVPKQIIIFTVKTSRWYCGRDHSSAFVLLNFGRYTYIRGYRRRKRTHD